MAHHLHHRVPVCRRWAAVGLGVLALFAATSGAVAAPYRPTDDAVVLERLSGPVDSERRALRVLRRTLAEMPRNLDLALDLARRYLARGGAEADPRYDGYAQSALAPWWNADTPPVDVLVLRAVVHQRRHHFDRALEDLARALARRPNHAQARLTHAFVLQAVGRYDEALQDCRRLPGAVDRLVVVTCAGRVASLTGRAAAGYEAIRRAVAAAPDADPTLRLWALTTLAEIAARRGRTEVAERHFRDSLALHKRDVYLLGAYADFLLDEGRAEEAYRLLDGETRIDALLLRRAVAACRLGLDTAGPLRESLRARFAAERRRGSPLHQREDARFHLEILDRPLEALRLAEANWAVQKEPADAALLLKAAIAAGEPARAAPVAAWVQRMGLEDVVLDRLIRRLEQGEGVS